MVQFESLGAVSYSHHSNYGRTFTRFNTMHERDSHCTTTAYKPRKNHSKTVDLGQNMKSQVLCSGRSRPLFVFITTGVHRCPLIIKT